MIFLYWDKSIAKILELLLDQGNLKEREYSQ